ncbi:PA2169 family four-helix-bundle protein [Polaromonas sp.]|uniref:ferritin-like domain-containing protein n=1 Tax=Polaromonas sp. TaxID=1869339 RepID=UPI0035690335
MALDYREKDKDLNLDPITDAPGAHPVGTGLGAAAGGAAAGAAVGAFGGPAGAIAGAVVGAVAGGLGGKAVAEAINPTAEEAYWRDQYTREPYYQGGRSFDDYAPAYRLGLYGRSNYTGTFDDAQSDLSVYWDSKRENSTLSWPEAEAASRAAWTRADDQLAPSAVSSEVVDNDDVVDTLNNLLESGRDGEFGYTECAEHVQAQDIKTLLLRHADECRGAAAELARQVRELGGEPDEGGTTSGALHRGWVSVRGKLSGYTDLAMLEECERGEDTALARYRKALKGQLPSATRALVERQAQGAQRNHDQIKAMRDALKAAS